MAAGRGPTHELRDPPITRRVRSPDPSPCSGPKELVDVKKEARELDRQKGTCEYCGGTGVCILKTHAHTPAEPSAKSLRRPASPSPSGVPRELLHRRATIAAPAPA